jgi:DNA-binding GntR family transcriptional regulator
MLLGEATKFTRAAPAPRIADLLSGVALNAKKTYVSQIFTVLKDLIVSVRLHPGQMISEKEVAEVLTASKTPVREALIRLEDAGLVNIVAKSGSYVSPIDIDRYLEACFVRLRLETGAVRRACAQNDKVWLARMNDLMGDQERSVAADDYETFFTQDEALHRMFFDMARLPGVWNTVKRGQFDLDRVRHLKRLHNIRRGAQVIAQHWAIVRAIQSGNANAAEAALVDHIGSLEGELQSLSAHPALLAHIETLNTQPTGARARRV